MSSVLRLGHRPDRDKRMTTHVGLTSRAFGLDRMYMPKLDRDIKESLEDVADRFGGDFRVEEEEDWKHLIERWEGDTIHLTMYGEDINRFFEKNEIKNPLIIVGSKKVPRKVYDIADHNVAVGAQPHSEVASLAVFLDRYNNRSITKLKGGEISILPSKSEKRVIDHSNIPTAEECYRFAREKGMDDDLMKHTMAVLDRALHLQESNGGDLRLVIAGALLHDVGRTVTHGVDHGVEGAHLIKEQGWSEELAKIVERHIGGGITREEAEEVDLPLRNYVPETLEEKIVCHADNTAGGKERFEQQIERTEEQGYHKSAKRMRKFAEEFSEDL
ncbi:MAG: HDIG domain-containing protein [Candidatus Thermoplasmatota archaeon]|nr:HDIG domain-containing protein [Candidatus Thermoplasmatota archaeon]MBS3789806.1 HDIG domain-containing protein [Candidatus Thermoplasmatota archaeon]